MNEGIQIAQRGALVIRDPVVAVGAAVRARSVLSRRIGRPQHDIYGIRFMGFFIKDPSAGTVVGQFPHLFPGVDRGRRTGSTG